MRHVCVLECQPYVLFCCFVNIPRSLSLHTKLAKCTFLISLTFSLSLSLSILYSILSPSFFRVSIHTSAGVGCERVRRGTFTVRLSDRAMSLRMPSYGIPERRNESGARGCLRAARRARYARKARWIITAAYILRAFKYGNNEIKKKKY